MSGKPARGIRRKTRSKFKRKGPPITVNKVLQEIPAGERVQINIDSSVHSAMPHYRYQGKTGLVLGKRGRAYEVKVRLGNQLNTLVVKSEHLQTIAAPAVKVKQ